LIASSSDRVGNNLSMQRPAIQYSCDPVFNDRLERSNYILFPAIV
jgi:hypothetical protein